jgi:hypothetical protein
MVEIQTTTDAQAEFTSLIWLLMAEASAAKK